ncbi:MAG: hypothetical protein JXJ19_00190 [Elusimicrobia bacterium]|nr:hypothetical protein [Elusimicrobiota bacterium]
MDRNPEFYTKELLNSSVIFDGPDNDYTVNLTDDFNDYIRGLDEFRHTRLRPAGTNAAPDNVIWIDASQDGLPATRESARVAGAGTVVNERRELLEELGRFPSTTLVLSQCVKKDTYDVDLSRKIDSSGSLTSPGPLTAPGSVFSDKLKTYDLLSSDRKNWDLVAKYSDIQVDGMNPGEVAREVLRTASLDAETDSFFVKPTEGGGGLGGFRLIRESASGKAGYVIPDLSRVSGSFENAHIVPLTIDPSDDKAVEELWWLYGMFSSVDVLRKNYIHTDIKNSRDIIKLLGNRPFGNVYSEEDAAERLAKAIESFESKFNKRYRPLVCHYIDFGAWGLRAHYRLTVRGIEAEVLYARIFQISFEKDSIGYVGSDNISNKQTGELELGRLAPINSVMVEAVGGKDRLFSVLLKGARATKVLIGSLPAELRDKVPVRMQFDLAPAAGLIGEGNSDSARGFCIAQRWDRFESNISEWYDDSLAYYSYIKSR